MKKFAILSLSRIRSRNYAVLRRDCSVLRWSLDKFLFLSILLIREIRSLESISLLTLISSLLWSTSLSLCSPLKSSLTSLYCFFSQNLWSFDLLYLPQLTTQIKFCLGNVTLTKHFRCGFYIFVFPLVYF